MQKWSCCFFSPSDVRMKLFLTVQEWRSCFFSTSDLWIKLIPYRARMKLLFLLSQWLCKLIICFHELLLQLLAFHIFNLDISITTTSLWQRFDLEKSRYNDETLNKWFLISIFTKGRCQVTSIIPFRFECNRSVPVLMMKIWENVICRVWNCPINIILFNMHIW